MQLIEGEKILNLKVTDTAINISTFLCKKEEITRKRMITEMLNSHKDVETCGEKRKHLIIYYKP